MFLGRSHVAAVTNISDLSRIHSKVVREINHWVRMRHRMRSQQSFQIRATVRSHLSCCSGHVEGVEFQALSTLLQACEALSSDKSEETS